MKTITINFIATIILAIVLALVLPWWSVMLAALVTGFLIPLKKTAVFFTPFLAVLLFWTSYCFMLSSANDFILAQRISILFPLGGNPYILMLMAGLLGGLAAGIAAIFAKQLRKVIMT
jgi:hypothetical protein